MNDWLRAVLLAVVFTMVGAFAASLWLEIRRETPQAVRLRSGVWGERRIRVEVLNGAGIDGLARRATEQLRDLGFDVVYYGNAAEFDYDTSMAIARTDSIEPARRVADVLGLRKVIRRPDRNLYLDVSVVLGSDWSSQESVGDPPAREPSGLDLWLRRLGRAARRLLPG